MTKVWPHGAHATASAAGSITSHTFFASRRILAQVRLGTGIPFMRAQPHTASIKYKIEKLASTDYDHMFCLGPMRVALAAHVAAHACYDSARAAVYYVTPPPPRRRIFSCTEFKNAACVATGCLLALETQEGSKRMRAKRHVEEHGPAVAVQLRLMDAMQVPASDDSGNKGGNCNCSKVDCNNNNVFLGDSAFGSVKSAYAHAKRKKAYIANVANCHGGYPKQWIEDKLKSLTSGSMIFLTAIYQGVPMIATGYKFNRKRTLLYISTRDAGAASNGVAYEAKFPDSHGNLRSRSVPRAELISTFYSGSNAIDSHNHLRQYVLAIEKAWRSQDAFFRLQCTVIGMTVVDTYKLAQYHLPPCHVMHSTALVDFSRKLAYELVHNNLPDWRPGSGFPQLDAATAAAATAAAAAASSSTTAATAATASSTTTAATAAAARATTSSNKPCISKTDSQGHTHDLVATPKTKQYLKTKHTDVPEALRTPAMFGVKSGQRECWQCKHKRNTIKNVSRLCLQCDVALCMQPCFEEHLESKAVPVAPLHRAAVAAALAPASATPAAAKPTHKRKQPSKDPDKAGKRKRKKVPAAVDPALAAGAAALATLNQNP
jgi:hypothetical protein